MYKDTSDFLSFCRPTSSFRRSRCLVHYSTTEITGMPEAIAKSFVMNILLKRRPLTRGLRQAYPSIELDVDCFDMNLQNVKRKNKLSVGYKC